MKLIIVKNGINRKFEISSDKLSGLSSVLSEVAFIFRMKKYVMESVKNKEFISYSFNMSGIQIVDSDYFILFGLYDPDDDDLQYQLKVPQQAFWDLLDEYSKVINTDWKKIIIDFDGNKFDIKVEN